jgi:hypothetical protein
VGLSAWLIHIYDPNEAYAHRTLKSRLD